MADTYRARISVIEAFKAAFASVAPSYKVVRGPVDWGTVPQGNFQPIVSILFSEYTLFPTNGTLFTGTLTMEVVSRMKRQVDPGMADESLDEMAAKLEDVLIAALQVPPASGQDRPPIIRIHGMMGNEAVVQNVPSIRELVGADWSVQGLELTVTVDY